MLCDSYFELKPSKHIHQQIFCLYVQFLCHHYLHLHLQCSLQTHLWYYLAPCHQHFIDISLTNLWPVFLSNFQALSNSQLFLIHLERGKLVFYIISVFNVDWFLKSDMSEQSELHSLKSSIPLTIVLLLWLLWCPLLCIFSWYVLYLL